MKISGFRCSVAVVFAIVGCFASISGEYVGQIFRVQTMLLGCLTLEDGTDRLYRNVGKELPIYTA